MMYIYVMTVLTVCHAVFVLCANDVYIRYESDILAATWNAFLWPGEFLKNWIMLYESRKKTFLFENNIIKKEIYGKKSIFNINLVF